MNHEIKGEPFPVVICNLASGESVKCQAGAMAWMTENMEMKTQSGGLGKMFGKALTGEALFENIYTASNGDGMIHSQLVFPARFLTFSFPVERQSWLRRSHSLHLLQLLRWKQHSRRNLVPDFSVAKVSLCRSSQVRETSSLRSTVLS